MLALALLGSSAAWAGAARVTVTNTQAVLQYDAPDDQPCSVKICEAPDLSVLANDVDPAKFAGADLDSRAGNAAQGRQRSFVAGKRAAEPGIDKNLYSRALQAVTKHYYRITCSGGVTFEGDFTTANLMFGNTFSDPQPVDPRHPGEYAWPSLSFSDRNQSIVDPQTGLLIRHVTLPGDRVITAPNQNQPFRGARSATWSTPQAALTGHGAASIAGNDTGTLLLTPNADEHAGYISFFKADHAANRYSLNWMQVNLRASTDNPACNAQATDDCKLVACLTIDGVHCYAGGRQFQQAVTTKPAIYSFGRSRSLDLWQSAGARPPSGAEIATRRGSLDCDGSPRVTWQSGDYFATYWSAGSTLTIGKQDYTLSATPNLTGATLSAPCPAQKGAAFAATNFGVLVRKRTASANTISVSGSGVNFQMGVFPSWDFTGAFDMCSHTPVNGPGGRPGYNCALPENGMIYWIDAASGESHLFARFFGNGTPETRGCGLFDSQIFDAANPDIWYCSADTTVTSRQRPQRVHYYGNHLEPGNTQTPGHFEEGENLPACSGGHGNDAPKNQPCLEFSSVTGDSDMSQLTAAFDPAFQADRFRWFFLVGVENGAMIFRVWRSNHNSIGWTVVFDPNATTNQEPNQAGCVGQGKPGCVIAAIPSWSRRGARWCTLKGNNPMDQPKWLSLSSFSWGEPGDRNAGAGPYQSEVLDPLQFTKEPGTPGGPARCPANALGVTGDKCTVVRVTSEPHDVSPCIASPAECGGALETGLPGEIGATEVGDIFALGPANHNSELVRLLAKGGPDKLTWTLQRAVNNIWIPNPANAPLYTYCGANPEPARLSAAGEWYWDYDHDPHGLNATGKTVLGDHFSINSHFFVQNGMQASAYTEDPRCLRTPGRSCYQTRQFGSIPELVSTPPIAVETQNPMFAGKTGPAEPNQVQEHPSGPGIASEPEAHKYFFDGRPFNGAPISGSAGSDGSQPAKFTAPQLYQFAPAQMPFLDRKYLPTFAFAGSKPLLDVSGPHSVLETDARGAFEYCVAAVSGECRPGATPGQVFVNAPFVNKPFCHHPGQAVGMLEEFDLCIGNNAMVYNSVTQVGGVWVDNTGEHQRMLTKALGRNRYLSPFWHVHLLANGAWALTRTEYAQDVADLVFAFKVPPLPAADGVDRTRFIPVNVAVPALAGQAVETAFVEFGYAEYGPPEDFQCTSRGEACAVGAGGPGGEPFWYEQTQAARLRGVACANGCSIKIPALSQRVVYARPVYRDAAQKVVGRGPTLVLATP